MSPRKPPVTARLMSFALVASVCLAGTSDAAPNIAWELARALHLAGDLRGLTRALVLRHTDFGSLDNYLDGYSIAGDRLAGLAVPATILTAADDPVIPVRNFRALRLPPTVELDITAHGGHCGFISDWRLHTFAAGYIAQRMARHLDGAGGVDGGGCGIMGAS